MTKVLANRLGEVSSHIVHTAQAGFMKGRRIENQTKLTYMMIEWCNMSQTNGMIICLDQEKAYNKILHPFIWASFKKFKFSTSFINMVKALYARAKTTVILNREKSTSFKVIIRGV